MKSGFKLTRSQTILLALTLPVLGIASGFTQAQTTGRCVRADVPEAMVLPDGSIHAPGTMRICLTHKASPVTGKGIKAACSKGVLEFPLLRDGPAGSKPAAKFWVDQQIQTATKAGGVTA